MVSVCSFVVFLIFCDIPLTVLSINSQLFKLEPIQPIFVTRDIRLSLGEICCEKSDIQPFLAILRFKQVPKLSKLSSEKKLLSDFRFYNGN